MFLIQNMYERKMKIVHSIILEGKKGKRCHIFRKILIFKNINGLTLLMDDMLREIIEVTSGYTYYFHQGKII